MVVKPLVTRVLVIVDVKRWNCYWIGLPPNPQFVWLHQFVVAEGDVFVPVAALFLLNPILLYLKVNKIWIGGFVLWLERLNQHEGIALDVKAVPGHWIFNGNQFLYPIPPVPQLHCNLLVFRTGVVEMRIPLRVEGIRFVRIQMKLSIRLSSEYRLLFLPVD